MSETGPTEANETEQRDSQDFDIYVARPTESYPPLAVRWVNREEGLRDEPLRYFSWRYALVRYVLCGSGTFRARGKVWPVEAGSVCWSEPGIAWELAAEPAHPISAFVFMLAGEEVNRVVGRWLQEPVGAAGPTDPDSVRRVMEELHSEARAGGEHMASNCLDLARVALRRIHANRVRDGESETAASRTYRRCREYIDTHYAQIHTLGEVAEACGVSVPRICVLFKEYHDLSPYQYITRLKLNQAERLLLGPRIPIRDIARTVGYENWRVFSRQFKAIYGLSPTAYRKQPGTGR
jgi:AraC-like DNA-binding protein